jgi:hypothetical protein
VRLLGTGEKKVHMDPIEGEGKGEKNKTKQNPNGISMVNYVRV